MDDLRIYVPRVRKGKKPESPDEQNGGVLGCERMHWDGKGAVDWEKVGFGGDVDLHALISEEVFLCSLE